MCHVTHREPIMDAERFDMLARSVPAAGSRRRALAAVLGGLLALLGATETAAKPKKKKKNKKKRSSPAPPPISPPPPSGCSGTCAGKACGADDGCGKPCQTGSCPAGQACQSGQCVSTGCPTGTKDCGSTLGCRECCNDVDCCPPDRPTCNDSTVNGVYKTCTASGVCQCRADYPAECTFGSNPAPCHTCCTGADCVNDQGRTTCWQGNCVCPDEKPDHCRVFESNPLRYECTNVRTDDTNCGFCGQVCTQGYKCLNGQCVWQG